MKAQIPQERVDGPFRTHVLISLWQCGQIMWIGSSGKSLSSAVGVDEEMEGCMIGSFKEPISGNKNKKLFII